jgi:diguanylate cyclase (GGDEF)-like protein/PAS domain S-box-containing protein
VSNPSVADASILDRLTAARVLDLTPDLGVVTDYSGAIVWVNHAMGVRLGADGVIVGRHVSELVHPDDRGACAAAWARLAAGAIDTLEIELRFGTPERGWDPFLGSAGADPAAGLIVATHQETAALREAEERFRRSFEDAAIGMAITGLDGRFVRVNRSLADMLGRTREQLAGMPVRELTHPDHVADDREAIRALGARELTSYRAEKRYLRPDGTVAWVALGVSVVRDTNDTPQYFISQMIDISERRAAEEALAASEAEYRMLADHATDVISRHDVEDGRYRYVSPAAGPVLGWDPAELVGQVPGELGIVHPDDREPVAAVWAKALGSPDGAKAVHRATHRDGSTVWLESAFRCVRDATDRPVEMVCVARDVSERRHAELELAHRALHDALTGLPNRTLFHDRLGHALRRARRSRRGVAILFIDLDRFKDVNDSLGHKAGDRLLVDVCARLSGVLRPSDTLARFGGDELVLLCEDVGGEGAAVTIAQRVLGAFEEPFGTAEGEAFLKASIGIALARDGFDAPDDLVRDADAAMYRAKQTGGGRVEAFDAEMRRDMHDRVALESALRRGIERDELCLHCQPVVDMRDGSIQGFEALVRWQHPERGLVPPGDFIPIAEETGIIVELGAWVLREACATLAHVHAETGRRELQVGINIAPRQLEQPDFADRVRAAIAEHGLEASRVVLEITESTMMDTGPDTARTLEELRDLGVRLAMDDFGTGYSSLAHLHRFPLHILKVDRSFVAHVGDDQGASIAAAIVSLAKSLGLVCLAEGIEDERQREALLGLGCNLAQGFHFARPMPVADLTRALCASS